METNRPSAEPRCPAAAAEYRSTLWKAIRASTTHPRIRQKTAKRRDRKYRYDAGPDGHAHMLTGEQNDSSLRVRAFEYRSH
jgi:hypothetical protein